MLDFPAELKKLLPQTLMDINQVILVLLYHGILATEHNLSWTQQMCMNCTFIMLKTDHVERPTINFKVAEPQHEPSFPICKSKGH